MLGFSHLRAAVAAALFACVLGFSSSADAQPWARVAAGDFNGDGITDILYRSTYSGQVAVQPGRSIFAPPGPLHVIGRRGLGWNVLGTGDFNGDGTTDILWQHDTGGIAVWTMSDLRVTNSRIIGNPPSNWQYYGTSDFNGDGKTDILFSDRDSGQIHAWIMNGVTVSRTATQADTFATGNIFYGGQGRTTFDLYTSTLDRIALGVKVGSQTGSNQITNVYQFTFCPPFCTPDLTPNPTATAGNSGVAGGVFLDTGPITITNSTILGNMPLTAGMEAFYNFGSHTTIFPGIPGTGGIAPPAVMTNDSTKVTFGDNFGFLGKIGTIVAVNGVPFYVSFDFGAGWQQVDTSLNCTPFGACGFNGIPAQTLSTSNTLFGSLIGTEVNVPMASLPVLSQVPVLSQGRIGFQYLHADYGDLTTTMGAASQIQITTKQHVVTDSYMATIAVPLPALLGSRRP